MAPASERPPVIHEGLPTQLPDIDPEETQEWVDSLDALLDQRGRDRARYVMLRLLERAREQRVGVPALRSTDYINTIPPEREPWFPGDEHIERRIRAFIRWNAAAMVSSANRKGLEVGGHIASYQSAASLYEVGFNHFFRGHDHPGGGDQVFIQGHASPGIYARAFLEGRLNETQLERFRQEVSHGRGNGLSSYPHPRLMSDFWEFPTVSMGLTAINAIYQARFNRYLHNRGVKDTSQQHVWAFLGDGEMGEPESLGAIGVAAREELNNLTFVVNCNLQQLDGPVRGNGKIIQELESYFRGAGWNVVKVVWGRKWDDLLARDVDGALVNKMNSTPDGQFQTYTAETGEYIRNHFFGGDHRLEKMVEHLSDDDLRRLPRGGHDYRKVYAAFQAAREHAGQPTVILAKTVKGWTIDALEGRNATHQMKKLTKADLKTFRDRLYLPISDEAIDKSEVAPFFHPGEDSDEIRYMRERRRALGGALPQRRVTPKPLELPGDALYDELQRGSGKQPVATTMAVVRLLRDLVKDPKIGNRIVPIAPDEYRTFGMDSMFPTAKVYSPHGQRYESVDRKLLLTYTESTEGQLLHEGISEAGSIGSFTAAGSSYATHGEPMIPFYLFYSMFGFQRTGDAIWALADQLCRGFLIGATAGRTTLTGEGLQHADGHSPLLALTNPAIVHYDPAFAYEVGHIVRSGLHRMYAGTDDHPHGEDVTFYITVYNEPFVQPAQPDDLDVQALLKGIYRFRAAAEPDGSDQSDDERPRVQLLASGVGLPWVLDAQRMLADDHGVAADVWSVTSWNELHRDAVDTERWNLNHPGESPRTPYVTKALDGAAGPVLAVSDYMRAVPDQIARWVPGQWQSLG
ncbi:MAG: pyruvate dehydrogenase (acetyl-transferring), homodimeric type, partial [Propionibacteriales bacterium]|nr:pyruvate dehydrogenase (acetyl-transferring), homodimeric type [Propionibacteriales bacterium]